MVVYNWVDYILLAIFFVVSMAGIVRGGAKEIISILSWFAAYIVAGMFAAPIANYFTSTPGVQSMMTTSSGPVSQFAASQIPNFTLVVTFCILFFGTLVIGSYIGSIVGTAVNSIGLGLLNRLVGLVAGFVKAYMINVVIIFLVQLTSFSQQSAWTGSHIVAQMQPSVQWFSNMVSPGLESMESKLGQSLQGTTTGSTFLGIFQGGSR